MQLLIAFTLGLVCLSAAFPEGGLTPEKIEQLKAMKEKCATEIGLDLSELKELSREVAMKDEKLHCFGACILKAMGIIRDDGSIDKESAIAKIPDGVPKDKAMEIIDICSKEQGATPCETAKLIMTCFHEHNGSEVMHKMGH